jgi:hypothetical protein
MKRIDLVAAARPNFMKIAPLYVELARLAPGSGVVDVKGIVDRAKLEKRAIPHWRL